MNIIFTIDVEGHVGNNPIEHLIYGKAKNGKLCGIDMLMDMLDEYKMKGLFFVDIAEAWDYGEESVGAILKHIKERGHDVGVHIHPDHMADRKRMFLSEYSKSEQYEIIEKCTNFYEKVLGEKPKAFRAGKYGANWDTLDILADLGYKADFSQFFGQKWCHIDPPCAFIKRRRLKNGLLEVPVTSFISFKTKLYSRTDKIDTGQWFVEFRKVMEIILSGSYCDTIVLFAHSFSLINWRNKPNTPTYSMVKYKRMRKQLTYVVNNNKCQVCNLDNILENMNEIDEKLEEEVMPGLTGISAWLLLFCRAIGVLKSRIDIKMRKLKGCFGEN